MTFTNPGVRLADARRLAGRFARSKVLWASAVLLLLYALGGFLLAPYLVVRYLPSIAQERLGQRAAVEKVRINPFTLTFEASGLHLEGAGDKPLLAFKRLFVDLELSSVVQRAWTFADIRLEGADLSLVIDREGRLNLMDIIERLRTPPKQDAPLPRLVLRHLTVEGSRISLLDLSGATRASATLTPIGFELFDLSTLADDRGRYTLDAKLPGGGTLAWKGTLALQPIASTGELALHGMKIESAWQFLRDELHLAQPRGALSIGGQYDFKYEHGKTALNLTTVHAELSGLFIALRDDKRPLLALHTVRVSDASFALDKRELTMRKVLLSEGTIGAGVSEGGVLDWQQIASHPAPPKPLAGHRANEPAAAEPWHIRMHGIELAKIALDYSDRSRKPALAVHTAALSGALDLDVTTGGAARVIADGVRLALDTTAVTTPGSDGPLARLGSFALEGGHIDTQARSVHAASLSLKNGDVRVALGRDGPIGLLQMFSAPAGATTVAGEASGSRKRVAIQASDTRATDASPWRVRLDKVGFDQVAFQYADASRSPPIAFSAGAIGGDFNLDAIAGAGPARIVAADIRLAIDKIVLAGSDSKVPLATLDSFALNGGRVDTGARAMRAKSLAMSGGAARITRGRDGTTGLLALLSPVDKSASSRAASSSASAAQAAWQYRVDEFALKRFALALADSTYKPAIAYDIDVVSATATKIDAGSKQPIAFATELRIGERGKATASGTLSQDFARARATVGIAGVTLEPLRPLVAQYAALDLKSGNVSASARVGYRRDAKPAFTARGQASIDDVLVNEAASGDRFASWKTLAGDDVALSISPNRLAIREVRVFQPGAKIVIAKDRTINITEVVKKDAAAAGPAAKPGTGGVKTAAAVPSEPPSFPYEIERIRIERGTLDFADLSLVLPFATQVKALAGSIVGISSAADAKAELKLRGQIDTYGEARAEGVLIPRSPNTFLDIKAHFDNVEMPLLSPYSATFAGRKVAAGKLSLAIEYKIVNSELAGDNTIVLRDFKLGERVAAPNALDLPLDLAIALLKDSEGKITLAVPVRGNVGNPEFDYGKVIRGAIGNAITRVVTAPFRMLAGLFGKRDAEEMRTVEFTPGSARISPVQREQLDALAKAMKARPTLRIVVRGPYDPSQDGEQLRRRRARLELEEALGTKLKPGEVPGPVAYGNARTQKALETLAARLGGPNALEEIVIAYTKRTGKRPERVNPVLGLFGRGSTDREFYEAVFDRLVTLEPLPDTALQVLAGNRAQAIVETLVKAGVDPGRIQAGRIAQVKSAADRRITTELAVDVMPGAS